MESFKNVKDTQAAVLLGGPSGLFVFIARMTQTGVFKKIIFSMFCIKKKFWVDYDSALLSESEFDNKVNHFINNYSDLFEDMTCSVIII